MATVVVPIDPSNIQWVVNHQTIRQSPQCQPTGSSPITIVSEAGDFVRATNRCYCYAASSTNPGTCYYFSLSTTNHTISQYGCGQDTTCTKGCTIVDQFSTTTSSPCSTNYLTGAYSSSDYTSTSVWDSALNTKYFVYYTFSLNDNSCGVVSNVNRAAIYPTCTQLINNVYSITLQNSNGNVDQYACTDAGCNSCVLANTLAVSNVCGLDSTDSGTYFTLYRRGGVFNDPSLVLPTKFPNQTTTNPPTTTPGTGSTSNSSNIPMIAGIAGGVVVVIALVLGFVFWNRSRSKQAVPESTNLGNTHAHPGVSYPPVSNTDPLLPKQQLANAPVAHGYQPQFTGAPVGAPYAAPAGYAPGNPYAAQNYSAPYAAPGTSYAAPAPGAPYPAPGTSYAPPGSYPAQYPNPAYGSYRDPAVNEPAPPYALVDPSSHSSGQAPSTGYQPSAHPLFGASSSNGDEKSQFSSPYQQPRP
ncbi:uncharacterized protein BJ171DRAFT_183249 [Polychytrium aggregatum]|uniref:uncharacterized protein n=1 Tax=Polychytrium aggregatum TaxID=110093 RepID=UPI0022FE4E59|nr:uncharacterized protein BJ171DRAFT_183249 [Polychytrium aggregatum]KAI9202339.1 hypothetical protein BJ171DRAFT_183249 [Polychytrium aggregatum]